MKKRTPHVVLLLLVLFACNKEADIITSFDFTATVQNGEEATINVPETALFIISAERESEFQQMSFSYDMQEGGFTVYRNDTVVPPGTWISFDGMQLELNYTSDHIGENRGLGKIRDEDGRAVEVPFGFTVKHSDLQVNATTPRAMVDFESNIPITVLLQSNSADSTLTHKARYSFTVGRGSIYQDSGNGVPDMDRPVSLETFQDVEMGEFNFVAVLDGIDAAQLLVEVEDSNGQLVTDELDFSVNQEDFEVSVRMEPNGVTFGEPAKAIITITAPDHSDTVDYTVSYQFQEGSANFVQNGNPVEQSVLHSVSVGVTEWDIEALQPGDVETLFNFSNNTNISKTATETFAFNQEQFEVSARITPGSITVGEEATAIITIDAPQHSDVVTYQLRYIFEEGTATVRDMDGNVLNGNTFISVPVGSTELTLTGVEPGLTNIDFEVLNSTGFEDSASDSFEVRQKDFNFTASSNQQGAFTGESVTIDMNIEEIGLGGDVYTITFENGASTGTMLYNGTTYNPGQEFLVPVGRFSMPYTGTSEGDHNLRLFATSSSGVTKEVEIGFLFEKYVEPFTFSVTQANGRKLSGEPFNISVTTNATNGHDPNTEYFLSFQFDGTDRGSVVYNGVTYIEGEQIPIPHGFSNLSFTANNDEDFPITWTGSNSTDEEEQQNINVDMYPRPKISGVLTWWFGDNKRSCGNGCNWDYHYLVAMDVDVDPSATPDIFRITLLNDRQNHPTRGQTQTYTASFTSGIKRGDYHEFYSPTFVPTGTSEWYDQQEYTLTVIDSNGVEGTITGTFTNDPNDGQ